MIWLCWAGPTASGAAEGGSRGEQCRRSTKDDHYNMQSTQKSFPLQCTVERLLGSAIKNPYRLTRTPLWVTVCSYVRDNRAALKTCSTPHLQFRFMHELQNPVAQFNFGRQPRKTLAWATRSNLWELCLPRGEIVACLPQSWNTSSLCKSVKIFEPWFHVIETWVFYTIGSISNSKLLAYIIQHLILQGSFSLGRESNFTASSSDNQRSTFYVLPKPCTTWQLATLQTNFAPTVKEWLK